MAHKSKTVLLGEMAADPTGITQPLKPVLLNTLDRLSTNDSRLDILADVLSVVQAEITARKLEEPA